MDEDAAPQERTHGSAVSSDSGRATKRFRSDAIDDRLDEEPSIEEGGDSLGEAKRRKGATRRDASGWAKSRKGKGKDGRNSGRRSRKGTRAEREGHEEDEKQASDPKGPRLPKRQCALLIGFCGSGFSGMQIQRNARTIEGDLFNALVRAGAVSQDNANDPVKVNLGRAARTDAGVHAAGNVVSLKMITNVPGVDDIVARVNEELPLEIRLWGYVRVQNSFNARTSCDSRKYTYLFPTYLLIPPKPGSGLHTALHSNLTLTQLSSPSECPIGTPHPFWVDATGSSQDDLAEKRRWRIAAEQVEMLRDTARRFEGTHNFHNFTVGRDFRDRSNQRHMKKIEISKPVIYGETEWISVLFHGQSFMLHQIVGYEWVFSADRLQPLPNPNLQRKMMSILVLCCRTGTPSRLIDEMYGPRIVFVPKMPSLGLLLEHPIFDSYNIKVANTNAKLQADNPDHRPPIDFEIYRDKIGQFKQQFIYDDMRTTEDRDGIFDLWIRSIDNYGGSDLLYLNPKGNIPATAVIKQGEKRDRPFRERKLFDATSFPASSGPQRTPADEVDEDEDIPNFRNLTEFEG